MDETKQQQDSRIAKILKKDKSNIVKRQLSIVWELWSFMKARKKWWLLPIIITLALAGLLIIFGQASPLSPFIYALF
ncbi:hypothetical protein HYY73_01715 [Candidatus Woesearchaeota archaeon]|nr:hypothetical protein [Candidatus Woesearchaeota archaeon]